jgi:large subunit ribosomal protein L25
MSIATCLHRTAKVLATQRSRVFRIHQQRGLKSKLVVDPSTLMHNLTLEKIEGDLVLEDYLRANFPEAFEDFTQPEDEEPDRPFFVRETEPTYEFNHRPMTTYRRDLHYEVGSRGGRRIRFLDRMIPGAVYGCDPTIGMVGPDPTTRFNVKTPWHLIQSELDRYHRDFESHVYNLTVLDNESATEGETFKVIPQNVNRHPWKDSVYCVNFCRYHPGRPIKLPIQYINQEESMALKRDGYVIPIQRHIECFVDDGVDIPEAIEIECTGLRYKSVVRTDRVILPDGVRFSDRVLKRGKDYIIGVVYGKTLEEDDLDGTPGGKTDEKTDEKS